MTDVLQGFATDLLHLGQQAQQVMGHQANAYLLCYQFDQTGATLHQSPTEISAHQHLALQACITHALQTQWSHTLTSTPILSHPSYALRVEITNNRIDQAVLFEDKELWRATPTHDLSWTLQALSVLGPPRHLFRYSTLALAADTPAEAMLAAQIFKNPKAATTFSNKTTFIQIAVTSEDTRALRQRLVQQQPVGPLFPTP